MKLPSAFTECGVVMADTILNTLCHVAAGIYGVRPSSISEMDCSSY